MIMQLFQKLREGFQSLQSDDNQQVEQPVQQEQPVPIPTPPSTTKSVLGRFRQKLLTGMQPTDIMVERKQSSLKPTQPNNTMNTFSLDSFVDTLADWEGVEDHTDQIGKFTYGYGVLPATAKQFGVQYSDSSDRRENAKKVYAGLLEQIKSEQPDLDFNKLGDKVATAVFSTYINLGSFTNAETLVNNLKKGDVQGAADSLFLYQNVREDGQLRSSKGLVARRAKEYNLFLRSMGKTEGFVESVEVSGDRNKPVYILKDSGGNVVKEIPSKYPLAKGNSMKSVAVDTPTSKA